jgi:3-oxoacyl-[acyl-carrier protein] reductase
MTKEFEGKVALVTGASRGIGRGIAIKLASLGAKVIVNYVHHDKEARQALSQILELGGEAELKKADVSDSTAAKTMFSEIKSRWGKVDILVNNAGITRDTFLLRMPDNDWDAVINTNLRGTYLCTKMALRSMIEQSWGRIINITSLAGLVGNAGQSNYSAAKAGIIAFTKSVAREVGPLNITVNAIAPGFILTDMTNGLPQETKDFILTRIPLKRFGTPEDVANLAAFLASEQASYITAQVIGVDGGVI